MQPEVKQKLKQAGTVKDMLQQLMDLYKLEDCRPGPQTKQTLIGGLERALNMVKAQRR